MCLRALHALARGSSPDCALEEFTATVLVASMAINMAATKRLVITKTLVLVFLDDLTQRWLASAFPPAQKIIKQACPVRLGTVPKLAQEGIEFPLVKPALGGRKPAPARESRG
jgi:hypothetical protein